MSRNDFGHEQVNAPAGFEPLFRTSPVLELIGPLFSCGEGKDLVIGLRVQAKHCNARGTVHGGILATLADVALGYTLAQLAELEVQYTKDRHAVDITRATLFQLLRKHYQARDRLRLIIDYRGNYLNILLRSGEGEAEEVAEEYEKAKAQSEANYDEAATAAGNRKELSGNEQNELRTLWKKLVHLYHPDRFAHQPDKIETYQKLTSAINQARDNGDIERLREIANDPHGFILRQGWASLDFNDVAEVENLRRLLETLQLEIVSTIDSLNELYESSDFALHQLSGQQPRLLDEVAAEQAKAIDAEIAQLEVEAARLEVEIKELTGASDQPIE